MPMTPSRPLGGVRVLVAGAGLAGLSAARVLEAFGAEVTVVEARARVGGRVWTIRDGFRHRQHAEAGADLLDSDQEAVLTLAKDLGLDLTPILPGGFAFASTDARGRVHLQPVSRSFGGIWHLLSGLIHEYRLAERRWDGAIAEKIGRQSVAAWLASVNADEATVRRFRGLRGLFLADPEELSLLALVDFFATDAAVGRGRTFRVKQGNDRLATVAARKLRRPVQLGTKVRRVAQRDRNIVAGIEDEAGRHEIVADYLVCALPATTMRAIDWDIPWPDAQRDAFAHLRYGPATRLLVQFDRCFWRRAGRPRAFGSDQPTGAVWDGNEQQSGPPGILSFLAGGSASRALQEMFAAGGVDDVTRQIAWMGGPARPIASRSIVWEDDVWAGGGYAFFDPGFAPVWRDWLARPAGRVVFAGEHTSVRWQGYMNGAVESGQRAAHEVAALSSRRSDRL
jgi:monoamine oxidase